MQNNMRKQARKFLENHQFYGNGIFDGGNMKEDIIKLLEEFAHTQININNEVFIVTCPLCGGNKKIYNKNPNVETITCSKCYGIGKILE